MEKESGGRVERHLGPFLLGNVQRTHRINSFSDISQTLCKGGNEAILATFHPSNFAAKVVALAEKQGISKWEFESCAQGRCKGEESSF